MSRNLSAVLYVAAMIVVIVGVDLLFFQTRADERLAAKLAIVLVFGLAYIAFMRRR